MKDQRQKDRQSLANSQYRFFMKFMASHLADPVFKEWAQKEAITGSPNFVGQIDPSDSRISGFGVHYTRHIHERLLVSFNMVFQAGLREMCRTEVICSYALADDEKKILVNPEQVSCFPLDEDDVLEKDDSYIWHVWNTAEKVGVNGLKSIRKSELGSRGQQGMEDMAECSAALINPLICIAIGARNFIKGNKE